MVGWRPDSGHARHLPALEGRHGAREGSGAGFTRQQANRLYGITFDFASDRIRDESKATLPQVVAALKAHADWTITVEGHTDNVGGDGTNSRSPSGARRRWRRG